LFIKVVKRLSAPFIYIYSAKTGDQATRLSPIVIIYAKRATVCLLEIIG
jgi:hypothetical protein